jgi:RNA polymerase sigma-70 factor (ECF subfamily)
MNNSSNRRPFVTASPEHYSGSDAVFSSSRLSTTPQAPLNVTRVDDAASPKISAPARFEPTRWSVVLASAQTQAPGAKEALAELCRTYWQPLYAFARRRGLDHHRAQDAIQSFFLSLIESKSLSRADPLKGKFRSYLLASLQNHMLSEITRNNAQKRGGGAQLISIDEEDVESKFAAAQISNHAPAETIFEREWAVAAVEAAMAHLENDFVRRGKRAVFLALKPYLIGEQPAGACEQTAAAIGQSTGAVRTGIHRLRHDFRTHLRREVAKTVESPDQIDEEMRHLRTVLSASNA